MAADQTQRMPDDHPVTQTVRVASTKARPQGYMLSEHVLRSVDIAALGGVTTLDFVHGQNGMAVEDGYDLEVDCEGLVPTTDAAAILLRVTVGGVVQSGAGTYTWGIDLASGTPETSTSDTKIALSFTASNQPGNSTGESYSAVFRLRNLRSSTLWKQVHGHGAWARFTDGFTQGAHFGGAWKGTSPVDGIQIYTSAGDGFSAGYVTARRKARG